MPVRPPPLSLLRSSLLPTSSFSRMSLKPTHRPSGSSRILSRVFPLKLRFMGLGFSPMHPRHLAIRALSTRSRSESGSIRASKSLVEDEAELSDWVSELRTGSYKSGVFTDDDDEPRRGKKRGRDVSDSDDSNGFRDLDGGKRRGGMRGSNLEGLRGRGRGGNVGRGSIDLGRTSSRVSSRFGSDSNDEDDSDRNRGAVRGGMRGGRGGRDFGVRGGGRIGGRGERGGGRQTLVSSDDEVSIDDEDDSDSNRGAVRGGMRGGRGGRGRGEREFGGRGGRGASMRGGVREFGARGGGRTGGRGERDGGGRALVSSDDEVNGGGYLKGKGKSASSFMDLIGEEDSEVDSDVGEDDDEIEIGSRKSLFSEDKGESARPSSSGTSDSHLSDTSFDQCAISPMSLKAIKDLGYERMTVVQEATLPLILKGKDVMAKARTGTGKTVAFLLPSIEVVVKSPPAGRDERRPPIYVLVICPTRELASQAATEANSLLKYHPSIGVQVVIGGTRLSVEQKRLQANPCQILVATPGRLKDHIENTAGFATRLTGIKVLVLDEADHLLDMGFRRDIERIISAVPKQRQTLLFSATIPDEVRQISHIALKRDHEFVNTVEEGSEATHSQVKQSHLVAPLEKHFSLLYTILKDHIADDVNYKVILFCTTAMVTKLVATLLGELNLNVREIHSRKPQSYRTRVSDEFRKSKGLILVTSDVSARGVDYPDVTLVIQLGLPADKQQYIHRLGRTGRKGKEGQGILLLAPWEEFFLSSMKDLPISKAPAPAVDPDVQRKVEKALSHVEMKSKESAYQAWLGYYNSNKVIGRDKFRLVELANEFSRSMGLDTPPALAKMILGKMGLKNVPGLRVK